MVFVQTCPLCGGTRFRLFDQRTSRGYEVTNWLCLHDGLVFMSPRMDDEELARFYATEYRKITQGQEGPTARDLAIQSARAKHLAEIARTYLPTCISHLDIGCSSGSLMEAMRAVWDCRSVGIEPGDAYRAYCTDRGLTVYRSLEEMRAVSKERFDLVTMSHVLEHLTDPVGYLSMLRAEVIRTGGHLLVEVPNLYGHNCFGIAHHFAFSPHTLVETLRKAGFAVEFLKQHHVPRSDPRPLYLTVTARSLPDPIPEYRIQPSNPWLVYYRREVGVSGGVPSCDETPQGRCRSSSTPWPKASYYLDGLGRVIA